MTHDLYQVRIKKLVYGGQGLGELPDGRKVFVWNALPGEVVRVRLTAERRTYAIATAVDIVELSADRVTPYDVEYCFSETGQGLCLALRQRSSRSKFVVYGSHLAMPVLDVAANSVCTLLRSLGVRADDLHTIVVRCSQKGDVVGALFVKVEKFPNLDLPDGLKGLRVYSSASRVFLQSPFKLLQSLGASTLVDNLLDKAFVYDVDSFFQVNVPVFDLALARIQAFFCPEQLVDMYAGVGSIGLSVVRRRLDLIEADPFAARMAKINAANLGLRSRVLKVSAERALDSIKPDRLVILDPPRAGLHSAIVARLLEVKPSSIVYLSCDPATQARDLAKLQCAYFVSYLEVFNFFPRTPHIEILAILTRSSPFFSQGAVTMNGNEFLERA